MFLRAASTIFIFTLLLSAQNNEAVASSDDVTLKFETQGDQHQFHLGELIEVKYSYSAKTFDKYILVGQSRKLAGGRAVQISCSPSAEPFNLRSLSSEYSKFTGMLHSPCEGIGGGSGSYFADGTEYLLDNNGINFGPVPLNEYIRFRAPGTYTCAASAADVTTAPLNEKIRPALLIKSNPIILTITDDPAWARSADTSYDAAYEKLCRNDGVAKDRFLQCSDLAQRITYLDTPDSLATQVKLFDGRNHGWDNGFWDAIQGTSYPQDALRQMTHRIQDSDFEVSTMILELLAIWDLSIDSPDAFQTSATESYHLSAIEKLSKYVRLLGSSLSKKNPNVVMQSVKTYRMFAGQEYCQGRPLIPKEEQDDVLSILGTREKSLQSNPD